MVGRRQGSRATKLAGLAHVAELPGFEEAGPETVEAILDEAAKFASRCSRPSTLKVTPSAALATEALFGGRATIRSLIGFRVFADRVTGSKEIRAEPFAAQVQGGNVFLVAGNWVNDFL